MEVLTGLGRELLLAPAPSTSVAAWMARAILLLVLVGLLWWLVAFVLTRWLLRGRNDFGTLVETRLTWAWASVVVAAMLLLHGVLLWAMDRWPVALAAAPHATVALLLLALAARLHWHLRQDWKDRQALLRRAGGAA